MPKAFLVLLMFLILTLSTTKSFSFCAIQTPDTTKPKLSLPSFYEISTAYGKDDSIKSLINLFHSRRRTGVIETAAFGTLGIAGEILVSNAINSAVGYGAIGPALLGASILGYTLIGVITGLCTWGKFSKRHLLKVLVDYNHGIPLPKKFTKIRAFKRNFSTFK